jgi:hypothetical protein
VSDVLAKRIARVRQRAVIGRITRNDAEHDGVIREDAGRLIVRCDRCPARLDLGNVNAARARNRTPSGWLRTGAHTHACPLCSPTIKVPAMFAVAAGVRAQPLL